VPQLKCLSIRQPWAGLILSGRKRVENRSWPTRHRGLLAIHSSTSLATWEALSVAERDDYLPGWRDGVLPPCGFVLGVVELVDVCRHRDLPAELRDHRFALDQPENWCWVLARPRLLKEPVRVRGNSALFQVRVGAAELATACQAAATG
jgi:hypothetical protein